jgi:phosphatidylserine decarboxylase
MGSSWPKVILHVMPKYALTAVAGRIARHRWSRYIIPWYIRHYRVDVSDAEREVEGYPCLLDFFCRRLQAGARPLEEGVVSPVDGTVSQLGRIERGRLLQAKGATYSIEALLADPALAQHFQQGDYITLYLSPSDYHRIHMPLSGVITSWRYVPGSLFPVNRAGVRHIQGLFTRNERLITLVQTPHGRFAMVKIGATMVGTVRTPYGPAYQGPRARYRRGPLSGQVRIRVEKGEEVGYFAFGSTVIVVFERGMIDGFCVREGQTVRMGQRIAGLRRTDPGRTE